MKKALSRINNPLVKIFVSVVGLFILSLAILIFTPRAIYLAEKQVVSSNTQGSNLAQVLGVQQKQKVTIVSNNIPVASFSSKAVLAMDVDSSQVLYEKNSSMKLAPASTTKIMTGLIGVEHFKSADPLTVYPEDLVGGSVMGLHAGEQLSFRSLLYGMLLNSGNDAAFTIASNYPGGLIGFVTAMNQKVRDLGLSNSHFDNPAGFDSDNHLTTVYDMAIIARAAISNYELSRVVATKDTFVSAWSDPSELHNLKNLNQLLDIDGVIGIKTGTTEKAGEDFVGLVERKGHKVITVVFGSNDRFEETKKLMDWVYKNYDWVETFK